MTEIVEGFQDPDTASRGLSWIQKDPSDIKDYEVDWTDFLSAGESISSAAWTVFDNDWNEVTPGADALEIGASSYAPSNTSTAAKVWLKFGTVTQGKYLVTCEITTTSSPARVADKSFQVRMIER